MRGSFKYLIILFVFSGLTLNGHCQETLVKDSGLVAPFKGELRYKITWKGKGFDELANALPDSMIVLAAEKGFSVSYFGGMSDTLLQQHIWERKTGRSLLVYPYLSTAWESYPDKNDTLVSKLKRESRVEKIRGKSCSLYSLKWNNKDWKEEFWLWDSTRFAGMEDSLANNQIPPIYLAGLKGIPLRYVRTGPEGTSTAEIREIVPMKGIVLLPVPGPEIEIVPIPKRANVKHPVFEQDRKNRAQ